MSMHPNMFRAQFADLYGADMLPVLEELFTSSYELHPSRREKLFKVVNTDRDIWQYSELHDLELFNQIAEGEAYSLKRPLAGSNKTLVVKKYGLGISFSEELIEDGKFDLVADAMRKMGEAGRESQEISAMNILNNGFTTETTADGLSLFNAAHTLPSGGTMRNVLATASDLSPTSLRQALTDFDTQMVGDSGIIKLIQPKILLVSSSQRAYAQELVGSDLAPDSADNNMNSLKGEGLVVVSSPHLTDEDAWFVLSAPQDHGLRIVNRKSMETKAAGPSEGFMTDSVVYKSRYREVIAAVHPYGVIGTPGA